MKATLAFLVAYILLFGKTTKGEIGADFIQSPDLENILSNIVDILMEADAESSSNSEYNRQRSILESDVKLPSFLKKFDLTEILGDLKNDLLGKDFFSPFADFLRPNGLEKLLSSQYRYKCEEVDIDVYEQHPLRCEGPEISLELIPPTCYINDKDTNSFECEPAYLVYTREDGPRCRSKYSGRIEFTEKECRFESSIGEEIDVKFGGERIEKPFKFDSLRNLNIDLENFDIINLISSLFGEGDEEDTS